MARSPFEYFAQIEAQRARAFVTDREPLPPVSRESLRAVLTMDGKPPFIRYDQEGNPRLHISAHAVFAAINIAVVYFVFWVMGGSPP